MRSNGRTYYSRYFLLLIIGVFIIHLLYPLRYVTSLNCIRHIQHELINNEHTELKELVIPLTMFSNSYDANEKEIEIDGKTYDVKCYTLHDNRTVSCKVLCDEKESLVKTQLSKNIDQQQAGKVSKSFFAWWPMYYHAPIIFTLCNNFREEKQHFLKETDDKLCGYSSTIIRPPRPLI